MDLKTAQEIITAYGKSIESSSAISYGAPETDLPYRKDEIKEAIQFVLQVVGPEHQQLREALIVSYGMLALFLPVREAAILAKGHSAVVNKDPELAATVKDDIDKIREAVIREQDDLIREARSLLGAA